MSSPWNMMSRYLCSTPLALNELVHLEISRHRDAASPELACDVGYPCQSRAYIHSLPAVLVLFAL